MPGGRIHDYVFMDFQWAFYERRDGVLGVRLTGETILRRFGRASLVFRERGEVGESFGY